MPRNATRRDTRSHRDSRAYRTPGVIHDNLARELTRHELEERLNRSGQIDFDQQYRRRQESNADRLSRQRKAVRATVRQPQKIPVASVAGSVILAVLAVMVVYCQVQINEISSSIVTMKKQISELEEEQISLQTRYEQAFDPAAVKAAAEAAGMQQPGEGQVIYIDLPGEDQTVSGMEKEDGVLTKIFTALNQRFYTVLEYFR